MSADFVIQCIISMRVTSVCCLRQVDAVCGMPLEMDTDVVRGLLV